MTRLIQISLFLLLLAVVNLPGQKGQIRGKVTGETNEPLAGVNIAVTGTVLGAASDLDGHFVINRVPKGRFQIVISMLGYQQIRQEIQMTPGDTLEMGTLRLPVAPVSGETVVVTASKYEQEIQNAPASISLISRQELQTRNTITLDKALQYVPGVTMNASQMNIRGSAGYSRGVGSRVMFLLDGIPILTGDTREVSYDVLPTYLVERVEIVKGAGSALYGSSALGGVVNIITPDIERSPRYYVKTYGGVYSQTAHDQWNWSEQKTIFPGFCRQCQSAIRQSGTPVGRCI